MNRISALVLLTRIFFSPSFLNAQTTDSITFPQQKLRIISWNIYMLPRFVKNTGKLTRAKKIGDQLNIENVDVIVFQEAFHGGARKKIKQRLLQNFPYVIGPANQSSFSLKANSGIWIFSKYPVLNHSSIVFKSCYGVDALSKKGALLVELDVNGKLVQVVGTHLQNAGRAELKELQCKEIFKKLLKPNEKPGIPQVICGDFNIEKQSKSYRGMLASLNAEDGTLHGPHHYSYDRLTNDLQTEKGQKRDLIDYILLRNNNSQCQFISQIIKPFKLQWHKNHQDLSDHYPLVAEILMNNAANTASLKE